MGSQDLLTLVSSCKLGLVNIDILTNSRLLALLTTMRCSTTTTISRRRTEALTGISLTGISLSSFRRRRIAGQPKKCSTFFFAKVISHILQFTAGGVISNRYSHVAECFLVPIMAFGFAKTSA